MNGFGYGSMNGSPYGSGMGGGYMGNQYNQNNQQQPPEDQQNFMNSIRTLVSGLSAVTGISYGLSTFFGLFYKAIKFLNIFKGKKKTTDLLDSVWRYTVRKHSRRGVWQMLKILVVSILFCSVHLFSESISRQAEQNCKDQQEASIEEEKEEANDISVEDFMLQRKSDNQKSIEIGEENEKSTEVEEEESIKLDSLHDLSNCELFTISEDTEKICEFDQTEVKGDLSRYLGHHI
ncbi:unnamed protein product [Moneuplotes crassus]|uniref:Transmembrane protein n=1 Tax=Euplotes crassus TaxID=5936 RepID=A0AAD1XRE2_EUPCR|nr:unnamed protein product [Moneuplotes crassus]